MDIILADWMFALAASRDAMTDGRLVRAGQAIRRHHKARWLPTPSRGILRHPINHDPGASRRHAFISIRSALLVPSVANASSVDPTISIGANEPKRSV